MAHRPARPRRGLSDHRLVGLATGSATLNQNLPEYVVLGVPTGDCCGGEWTHGGCLPRPRICRRPFECRCRRTPCRSFPPGRLASPPRNRRPSSGCSAGSIASSGIDYPDDPALQARIKSYELAFGMQTAVPEVMQLEKETAETQEPIRHGSRTKRGPSACSVWRLGGWSSVACASCRSSTAAGAAAPGTPTAKSSNNHSLAVDASRQADRRPVEGPETPRTARRDDRGLGHRVRPVAGRRATAAIIIRKASAPGWPAAASRAASPTARPTRSASTPSRTGTTSPTSTPPSCTSWASTRASSKSPAANGWISITASRFARLWREATRERAAQNLKAVPSQPRGLSTRCGMLARARGS